MIDTGFKDRDKRSIFVGTIVKSNTGNIYRIAHDPDLGYILFDIIKQTIEKINKYCEEHLEILIQCLDRAKI